MSFIDPTYLRYVYDGFQTGAISSENSSVLPNGLVGVYEEAFINSTTVSNRSKLLDFFSVWALLKKEVSAAFVLPLLSGWTEEHVLECIAEYSRWFNSPASGKYQIYHERLRTFVLQRISAQEFRRCNESIIRICREALTTKSNDEWDIYALEHLSTHLLIPAMEGFDSASLKTLAYDVAHWNRQIEISKGYDWTKKMHNEMMVWASKYDDEQVIECALNKVDLYHLEQNDAPRIVELVAQNDIETALSRIESFGGNDKDGLQRKFILYMLCLMELTLLDSKAKLFRRDAIEKILKHLDENLPVDHSLLNWDDFFPSYLMFQMSYVWRRLDMDYLMVYEKTDDWKKDWIEKKGPYNPTQFEILITCADRISDKWGKNSALVAISSELAKQKKVKEAISCANRIIDEWDKSRAFANISLALAKQGRTLEALDCTRNIGGEYDKRIALEAISAELAKQGKAEEVLAYLNTIRDKYDKSSVFEAISLEQVKQGKVQEALFSARSIRNKKNKSRILEAVSSELAKQEKVKEAISCANRIIDESDKSRAFANISLALAKQGNFEDALSFVEQMRDELGEKEMALYTISLEIVKQKKVKEILTYIRTHSDKYFKSCIYDEISSALAKHGNLNEAIKLAKRIKFKRWNTLDIIACEIVIKGNIDDALALTLTDTKSVEQNNVSLIRIFDKVAGLADCSEKLDMLYHKMIFNKSLDFQKLDYEFLCHEELILILLKNNLIYESVKMANRLKNYDSRIKILKEAISGLIESGKTEDAYSVIMIIGEFDDKIKLIKEILLFESINSNYFNLRKIFFESIIDKAINNERLNINENLSLVFNEFILIKSYHYAIAVIREINGEEYKHKLIISSASFLINMGLFSDAILLLDEALSTIQMIPDKWLKVNRFLDVVSLLIKVGNTSKVKEVLDNCYFISTGTFGKLDSFFALNKIALLRFNAGLIREGQYALEEAIFLENFIELEETEDIIEFAYTQIRINGIEAAFDYLSDRFQGSELHNSLYLLSEKIASAGDILLATNLVSYINDNNFREEANFNLLVQKSTNSELDYNNKILIKFSNDYITLMKQASMLNDIVEVKNLLQKYVMKSLFFQNISEQKIHRFNRTLNIQWAIDIKNSFSAN